MCDFHTNVILGLVPVVVSQRLLGRSGEFLIITMVLMAVTSTGSAEVMAVTSILVYDVYQLYLKRTGGRGTVFSKEVGQGPSWSPVVRVSQSASFKNALVQD
ncbi:hypothetical protein FSP39_020002 [Pinctada imbricata]|uniref:Uncharacterized protein n=1 Tax=Pinctada imbricata TaxID=66713 RepID=A0AA89C445_PINIB|nr:hypothetical protein FSP39_020002 [Pinctada imbricata]